MQCTDAKDFQSLRLLWQTHHQFTATTAGINSAIQCVFSSTASESLVMMRSFKMTCICVYLSDVAVWPISILHMQYDDLRCLRNSLKVGEFVWLLTIPNHKATLMYTTAKMGYNLTVSAVVIQIQNDKRNNLPVLQNS